MSDKITNQQQYDRALERIAELRANGEPADRDSELAALEAAVAGYSVLDGEPAKSKGRPEGGILDDR